MPTPTAFYMPACSGVASVAPSAFFTDTFIGSVGTSLLVTTPDVGSTWTRHDAGGVSIFQLDGAGGLFCATLSSGGNSAVQVNDAAPSSADYTITADFRVISHAGNITGLTFRDTATGERYELGYNQAIDSWRLNSVAGGSRSILANLSDVITDGTVRSVTITLAGTSLSAVVAGIGTLSATNSAHTTAGNVGFFSDATVTSSTGVHIENVNAI